MAKDHRTVEELQDDLNDSEVSGIVKTIRDALSDAESCETVKDFQANMRDLIDSAKALVEELKAVISR